MFEITVIFETLTIACLRLWARFSVVMKGERCEEHRLLCMACRPDLSSRVLFLTGYNYEASLSPKRERRLAIALLRATVRPMLLEMQGLKKIGQTDLIWSLLAPAIRYSSCISRQPERPQTLRIGNECRAACRFLLEGVIDFSFTTLIGIEQGFRRGTLDRSGHICSVYARYSIRISKESAIYSSGASRGLKFFHLRKLSWTGRLMAFRVGESGGKWAPRRRGLSFFLGIVFRLAITSPMKNSAQLSKRTGNRPKPSRVDLKNLYYRETESYSAWK
jgi:hypothetical protein